MEITVSSVLPSHLFAKLFTGRRCFCFPGIICFKVIIAVWIRAETMSQLIDWLINRKLTGSYLGSKEFLFK